jgi:glucose/arabinose dehydrogenase
MGSSEKVAKMEMQIWGPARPKGRSPEIRPGACDRLARLRHRPNVLAFHKGALYNATRSRASTPSMTTSHSPPNAVLVNEQFPKDEPHGWKFIAIGPDDKLYVPVGAPGDGSNLDTTADERAIDAFAHRFNHTRLTKPLAISPQPSTSQPLPRKPSLTWAELGYSVALDGPSWL